MATAPSVEDTVRQASFVFVGTVARLGATTVRTYAVQPGTAVVKVDRVFRAPEAVGNLSGREITVQLNAPPDVKAGDEAIFFARGVIFAESIVVQEVAPRHKVAAPTRAKQLALVHDVVQRLPDLQVQAHAAESDLVVVGRVTAVRTVPTPPGPITHHDPDWQEAEVAVESVESGKLDQKTIAFLFPASEDVKWYHAPKLKAGMEGVFLLHKRQVEELKRESHVILDPMDFHPRERVEGIRRTLRADSGTKAEKVVGSPPKPPTPQKPPQPPKPPERPKRPRGR